MMRRYSAYKESGVEWLGEVPEGWDIVPLKAVVTCNDETLPDDTDPDYLIEYVEISGVDAIAGLVETSSVPFASAASRARRIVRDGDVLISTVRTYLRAIAQAVEPPANLIASTGFAVLRPRTVDSSFLGYLVRSEYFISHIIARSVGVSYPAINASEVMRLDLPLPSPAEQQAIAAFLDRETVKIDALVAEQRHLIDLLKEKRRAVISHAVTKGLDPTAPMKDSRIDWLGEVPEGWEVVPIRKIARLESGHTPSRSHPEWWVDCTTPWFSLADIWQVRSGRTEYVYETAEMVSDLGLANSSARLLPQGTVMLSRTASVGFSAIMGVPMATTQDFANWVCGQRLQPEFLLYCLRGMPGEFERLKMGSTHNTIYMPDIAALVIALPPVGEQAEIVGHIREEIGRLDALVDASESAIALLQERRAALISAAVTGKIDVRDTVASTEAA